MNIEGAFACGDEFILLQRGNQTLSNACIRYALDGFVRWCVDPLRPAPKPDSIELMDLGDAQGVPLTFTDGASVGDGSWVFSAVAERTSDSYVDGACVAAAVGLVGPDRAVRAMRPIRPLWKIEGIDVQPFAGALRLTMTTDADDPSEPSKLLVGTFGLGVNIESAAFAPACAAMAATKERTRFAHAASHWLELLVLLDRVDGGVVRAGTPPSRCPPLRPAPACARRS